MARHSTTAMTAGRGAGAATEGAGNSDPRARLTESKSVTGQSIGAIFALCAFAVGIVSGIFSGNAASSVVGRALVAMIVCYPVGLVVGMICQRVISDHINAHVDANPVPDLDEHQQHDGDFGASEASQANDAEEPMVV